MKMLFLLLASLLSLTVSTFAGESDLAQACTNSRTSNDYAELIRTLAFDEARDACDREFAVKPKRDCRAKARYWLAVREFAEGNFDRSQALFREAKSIVGSGKGPAEWYKKPGWGATDDMIRILAERKALGDVKPEYSQKVMLLAVRNLDADNGDKHLRNTLDPCDVRHLELSMRLLSRYLETFTSGAYSMALDHTVVETTATKLERGKAVLNSFSPWNDELTLQLTKVVRSSDVIVFLYPKGGGIADGGGYGIPLLPGFLSSPKRGVIRLPTGWATISNYAQIFHEYLHTVEAMTGIKTTTHGVEETARVLSFTGLQKGTGESNWAEWYFRHTLQEKADALRAKKGTSGWQELFGGSVTKPLRLSEAGVRALFRDREQAGEETLKERLLRAKEQDTQAYKYYNSGHRQDAATSAVEAVRLYPWQEEYLNHARWFIRHSGLPASQADSLNRELETLTDGFFNSAPSMVKPIFY